MTKEGLKMAEPFLGEIRLFTFDYAPRGWALCDGSLLQINQNQALFSLLGTAYGGDGIRTFALPDLRGRTPVHVGNNVVRGEKNGEENHTLAMVEMPMHTHKAMGSSEAANSKAAVGQVWASSEKKPYGTPANKGNSVQALTSSGTSQSHQNMQPFTVVNYCIALMGTWPPRS
jgi:microcystin-dependent protein